MWILKMKKTLFGTPSRSSMRNESSSAASVGSLASPRTSIAASIAMPCAATGSACTTDEPEPSHVLLAMGVEPRLAQGTIRFSLGHDSTEEEIDQTIETMAEVVPKLRAISSFA